jgi:hypothetical protein
MDDNRIIVDPNEIRVQITYNRKTKDAGVVVSPDLSPIELALLLNQVSAPLLMRALAESPKGGLPHGAAIPIT